MYVLDTNMLIYFFKGMGRVATHLLGKSPKEIAIPSIVLYELEVGIAKSNSAGERTGQLFDFISLTTILPFGYPEAKQAAGIRVGLESQGTPIGPYDILIAATAMSNDGILVTHNTREFERIIDLRLEDWY